MNRSRILTLLFGILAHHCKGVLGQNALRRIQSDVVTVPNYDPEIRGGDNITEAVPWFVSFADQKVCGGVLVS